MNTEQFKINIERLEKLNTLKEKGIITEEQFKIEKKNILNEARTNQNVTIQSEGINWGSAIYALCATVIPALPLVFSFMIGIDGQVNLVPFFVFLVIEGLIFVAIAQKKQTYLYKKCLTPWALLGLILITGPIAMCIALYQFYQIDDGLVEFK